MFHSPPPDGRKTRRNQNRLRFFPCSKCGMEKSPLVILPLLFTPSTPWTRHTIKLSSAGRNFRARSKAARRTIWRMKSRILGEHHGQTTERSLAEAAQAWVEAEAAAQILDDTKTLI